MANNDQRLQFNDLNKTAYSRETVSQFNDDPNVHAMGRVNAKQLVEFVPGVRQQGHSSYSVDTVNADGLGFDTVNREIWNKRTRLLDFACGTGAVTKELLPHIGSATGLDLSPGMVDAYNKRFENHHNAEAEVCDLLSDEYKTPSATVFKFDVVLCSLSYHHIPDIQTLTDRLADMLEDGGWLMMIDFDGPFDPHLDDSHVTPQEVAAYAKRQGLAHTEMNTQELVQQFGNSGLKNVQKVRGWELVAWFDDEVLLDKMFVTLRNVEWRINPNGKRAYKRRVKLQLIVGQK